MLQSFTKVPVPQYSCSLCNVSGWTPKYLIEGQKEYHGQENTVCLGIACTGCWLAMKIVLLLLKCSLYSAIYDSTSPQHTCLPSNQN